MMDAQINIDQWSSVLEVGTKTCQSILGQVVERGESKNGMLKYFNNNILTIFFDLDILFLSKWNNYFLEFFVISNLLSVLNYFKIS